MSTSLTTLMDSFFDEMRPITSPISRAIVASPALNVREYADKYEISLTVPGIEADKIDIELTDKLLTFSYEHTQESKDDSSNLLREEYRHYSFSRSVGLPKNVDEDSIEAHSHNGILTVVVKKQPQAQPKKVSISVKK